MPTYVLGTGLSHDGSACLLKDGRVEVAVEKERITRIKHDGGNDTDAITYCLEAAGIELKDLDLVVQQDNFGMFEYGNDWYDGHRLFDGGVPVVALSHHLAHAYSAVGTCPFDEMAVLVIDGCGNAYEHCLDLEGAEVPERPPRPELSDLYFEKDSYYHFTQSGLRTVYKDFSAFGTKRYPMHPNTTKHSIGGLYLGVSMYVFGGMEDPGKLMGLAPFGKPGAHDFQMFDLRDGRAFVNYDWMRDFTRPARSFEEFKENFQYYADIAFHTQRELERALLYVLEHRSKLCGGKLAFAGGVALNATANRLIRASGLYDDVYFQPAAADNGLALGCAYYGWMHVLGNRRVEHDGGTCFGREYDDYLVETALEVEREHLVIERPDDLCERVASLLADGKTVGWFQGAAEFGPRALGHRSILADPRRIEMRDHINANIKFREDFRPFAPSVLKSTANTYFECTHDSAYMIEVVPVRDDYRDKLAAVVHEDGSSRVQTVTEDSDPLYARLLASFGDKAGMAVLLNTSFNRRGMPIVETPTHAVDFYLECALDVLAIGPFVVTKKEGFVQRESEEWGP